MTRYRHKIDGSIAQLLMASDSRIQLIESTEGEDRRVWMYETGDALLEEWERMEGADDPVFRREFLGRLLPPTRLTDLHPLPWSVRPYTVIGDHLWHWHGDGPARGETTYIVLDANSKSVAECDREDIAHAVIRACAEAADPACAAAAELEAALRAVILASLTDPESENEPDPAYDPDALGKATALLARIDAARKATS